MIWNQSCLSLLPILGLGDGDEGGRRWGEAGVFPTLKPRSVPNSFFREELNKGMEIKDSLRFRKTDMVQVISGHHFMVKLCVSELNLVSHGKPTWDLH